MFVVIHITGVIFSCVKDNEYLVNAMINGIKVIK
jgi:cytochrome b